METQALYRPVGLFEFQLIRDTDFRAFPPRLPEQPIFYPVLNFEYAAQIAQQWNTKDAKSGYMGAVTRFELPRSYLSQFDEHVVGNSIHRELWVPAEELHAFNAQIIGKIEVVAVYYGEQFRGEKLG
ncbi:MAG: ADP-ribosylation/crystallin J1 [Chloroflexi bacterium]|nr:ADP-ribosylation/crystallin J1 [Chloroflexota bacterium]